MIINSWRQLALHYIVMVMWKSTENEVMIIKNFNDNNDNNRVPVLWFF